MPGNFTMTPGFFTATLPDYRTQRRYPYLLIFRDFLILLHSLLRAGPLPDLLFSLPESNDSWFFWLLGRFPV